MLVLYKTKFVKVVFLCLFSFIKSTEPVPIAINEEIEFTDIWNYKLIPRHDVSLLNVSKDHLLPSIYQHDANLNITSLNVEDVPIKDVLNEDEHAPAGVIDCGICVYLFQTIKQAENLVNVKKSIELMCILVNFASPALCKGIVDVFGSEVFTAIKSSKLTAGQACMMLAGEICPTVENELHDWYVETPKSQFKAEEDKLPKLDVPMFKVLHLSDTHLDPDYAEGSPVNCKEPLCCRNYSTPSDSDAILLAGRWGSYGKCDSPKILIENMLKNIATTHPDIDYIIWTGDLPPHDIWNQTKQGNLDIIKECVEQMLQYFPNTPIFPAVGNHESVPAGFFAPPWMNNDSYSINWLYTRLADHWKRWLPSTSVHTILHGAFYSVLLRPGFRLISLNTNYCHSYNIWLLLNSTDPAQELQWLIYELQKAESSQEKVHIIGHIPPGSFDCLKIWSKSFYNIVDRYHNTITAQFYGHSHADEFELFYDSTNYSRPINVAYLGPSITTFSQYAPAYRIYYVEGDHYETRRAVVDHETWTTDLDKANIGNHEPYWYKLYSAKDIYDMESLSPNEWNKLLDRMKSNSRSFDLFYRNYHRDSPVMPPCGIKCRSNILCDLKTGLSSDRKHFCHDLQLS